MLLIQTRSNSPLTKEFWKWLARRITGKYSGPQAVTDSLLRGLQQLDIPHKHNKTPGNAGTIVVLSGVHALQEAIEYKKAGRIDKLIAGPNVTMHPHDHDKLICDPAIDAVITPSSWTTKFWRKEAPEIAAKIASWPAGVPVAKASTRCDVPIIYNKLKDPELLEEIQEILGVPTRVFTYGSFKHSAYLDALADTPYLVYLAKSESQGIALQEAWSHDVPTLVNKSDHWMAGKSSFTAPQINCPYLTPELGVTFNTVADIPALVTQIADLHPKQYCDANFSDQASAHKLLSIINT